MNKTYFSAMFLFLLTLGTQAQLLTRKVLFLGNSYTSVNNLPQMVADAALSVSDTLIFDSNLPGGYTLIQHFSNTNSTSKIMAGGWDYVVLQEQSATPALQNGNFSIGAQQLCKMVKQYNSCAQPLFFMTWGRKNGDPANCPLFPLMCTYNGMDSLTRVSYTMEAVQNNTEVSPVGAVWKYIRQNYPNIGLYQADESHPSAEGSYAAAICFYTAIFKKSPLAITYNFSLNQTDAAIIRNAVKTVVFDHLSDWNFKVSPTANFDYSIGSGINQAIFNYLPSYSGAGGYANTFAWNFGDGNTTTLINPGYLSTVSNSYANGTYSVTLTVSNCDVNGVQQASVQHTISFCSHSPTVYKSYPWTCAGSETVSTQAYTSYQWYNNGSLIPGQVGQHLPLNPLLSSISVMATLNGCSEMSPPYLNVTNPGFYSYDIMATGSFIQPGIVCEGEQIKLTITDLDGTENIEWSKNGQTIQGATSSTLMVASTGTYAFSLFRPNCPSIIFYTQHVAYTYIDCGPPVTTGIKNDEDPFFLSIHPNPSSGIVTFSSSRNMREIEVFNLLGDKIPVGFLNKEDLSNQINFSSCPRGIYFVKASDGKYQVTKKIVLE